MIKNKDMDSSYGLMVDVIKAFGRMESKMEEEFIKISKTLRDKEFGQMERSLNGLLDDKILFWTLINIYLIYLMLIIKY